MADTQELKPELNLTDAEQAQLHANSDGVGEALGVPQFAVNRTDALDGILGARHNHKKRLT